MPTDDAAGGGPVTGDDAAVLRRCAEEPEQVDVDAMFDRLASDDSEERRLGARGLGRLARTDATRIAGRGDAFLDVLADSDDTVRTHAIVAIRRLVAAHPDAFTGSPVDPLIARLGREDQARSRAIAESLVELLDPDDPRLVEAVDRAVECFAADRGRAGSAIQALAVIGDAVPEPVVDRLAVRLDDEDPDVRRYAVRTLATLSADHAAHLAPVADRLCGLIDDEDDDTVRRSLAVLADVARVDPAAVAGAVPRLTVLVDAEHDEVRRNAVRVLVALGRADVDLEAATEPLRNRLDDTHKLVRRDAAYVLGLLWAESARSDLAALTAVEDLELRAVAEAALERTEDDESEPPLADLDPGEVFVARMQERGDG